MPPKRQVQTQGKRAREGSSNSDQDGDAIYLEMLERISALESKDKENTKKIRRYAIWTRPSKCRNLSAMRTSQVARRIPLIYTSRA